MTEKMKIEDFIMKVKVNKKGKKSQFEVKMLERILKYHPYEKLIDEEYIYPRGMDYVWRVLNESDEQIEKYTNLDWREKNKIIDKIDLAWTKEWINRFGNLVNRYIDFEIQKPISGTEFSKQFNISKTSLYKNISVDDISYIDSKNKLKYIKPESAMNLLEKIYIQQYLVYLSKMMFDEYGHLLYFNFKLKIPINQKTRVQKLSNKGYKEQIIKDFSLFESKYAFNKDYYANKNFVQTIKLHHPHEKFYCYVISNEGKKKRMITLRTLDWAQKVYMPFRTNEVQMLKKDITWTQDWLKRFGITDIRYPDMTIHQFAQLYIFKDRISVLRFLEFNQIKIKKDVISASICRKLEEEFPILKLAHLSKELSYFPEEVVDPKKIKNWEREEISKKQQKKVWLQTEDMQPGVWYYGFVSNRASCIGKGRQQILTVNVLLKDSPEDENKGNRKAKLRIPYDLISRNPIRNFFVAYMHIRFIFEEVEIEGKKVVRLERFILENSIRFVLDWSKSYYDFIPEIRTGRKKIKEEVDWYEQK